VAEEEMSLPLPSLVAEEEMSLPLPSTLAEEEMSLPLPSTESVEEMSLPLPSTESVEETRQISAETSEVENQGESEEGDGQTGAGIPGGAPRGEVSGLERSGQGMEVSSQETVLCLLCRDTIHGVGGDTARYSDHLVLEHGVTRNRYQVQAPELFCTGSDLSSFVSSSENVGTIMVSLNSSISLVLFFSDKPSDSIQCKIKPRAIKLKLLRMVRNGHKCHQLS
jgi:hypothetical protein